MPTVAYPSPSQLLSIHLDTLRYAFEAQGITPELGDGGDLYNRALANANRAAIAISNNKISLAQSNPLTSTGQDLINLCAVFGVVPDQPGYATGSVIVSFGGSAITLPQGFTGTIGANRYQTVSGGTYSPGPTASVQIVALVAGSAANEPAGSVFTWDSASIGPLSQSAAVDSNGIADGVDGDGDPDGTRPDLDAPLRARLLQKLSAPPVGGNASMAVAIAEENASVEAGYAYCGIQGCGSMDIAVTGAGAANAAGQSSVTPAAARQVLGTTLATIRTNLAAVYPGQEQLSVMGCTGQPVDITLAAVLALPLQSGGVGGGWKDPVPWPAAFDVQVVATSAGFISPATGVTGAGNIYTVCDPSTLGPSVGNSVAIWDPNAVTTNTSTGLSQRGKMIEIIIATVTLVSTPLNLWNITFQVAPTFVTPAWPLGAYVSADATNLVNYALTFAAAMALLGPGQKTALPELLPRAARQPTVDVENRSDLTNRLIDSVLNGFGELEDLQYRNTYISGTTTTVTSPVIPNTSADPPGVFVLQSFAIRKL
jgi:uncharacterized phage protein gp47/JayE